jgi:hypothetical protein
MQELRLEEKSVHQNKHTWHSYLQLNQIVLKNPVRMNFGIRPWMKNWIKYRKMTLGKWFQDQGIRM